MAKKLKVTLVRSVSGRPAKHRATVEAMGFHRMHETRLLPDNACMRGMVAKVSHMLKWEAVDVQDNAS